MAMFNGSKDQQLTDSDQCELLQHKKNESKLKAKCEENEIQEEQSGCCENGGGHGSSSDHHGICAICLDKILLHDTALVKGCEHAYCLECIIHWASYKKEPTCPQCKLSFDFLHIHRSLDGSIKDDMFEESVCLLLRASWFKPLAVEKHEEVNDDYIEELFPYEYEDLPELLDEVYYGRFNDYVLSGRQEAIPVHRPYFQNYVAGSSHQPKKQEASPQTGRRAKRAQKREAADKAAAGNHSQCLSRLGRA